MRWTARKWWNPFAVTPLMRQARRQGLTFEAAAAAAADQLSDEEMASVASVVRTWVKRRVAEDRPPARLSLLFLLVRCNRGLAVQTAFLALVFIAFRIFSSLTFSVFMSSLANSPADLVLLSSLPSPVVAAAVYSAAALGTSIFNYLLEQSAKYLENRLRMQLVWCVQDATLRANAAAVAPFSSSEVVSLVGIDAMAASWVLWGLPYAVVIPIEMVVQILLSISVIGAVATGYSMIPIAIFMVFKTVTTKMASRKQAAARIVQAQRLSVLSESIESNTVVKLMGTADEALGSMAALRQEEQRMLGWVALNNAYTLFSMSTLALQMAWVAMVVRANQEDLFSSSSIMTVLGFFRVLANYDLYRLNIATQSLAMASTSMAHHYAFYEAAARAAAGVESSDNLEKADSSGSKDVGPSSEESDDDKAPLVDFQNAAFSWSLDSDNEPTLARLTFALPRGKLIGVVGPIGSGKSSLLLALLGELQQCEGNAQKHSDWQRRVAYMPQRHWLQTGTLRDNVCYASPESSMGAGWVDEVVEACGMAHDVADFPKGLDHFIGEAGTSLSGGQQARVSLARAVHAAAAITVLDDPLCALDPGLGAEVFKRTMAPGGLLRGPGRSVILVTTNPAILAQCDVVAVVRGGTVTAVAPPAQLGAGALDFELSAENGVDSVENGATIDPNSDVMERVLHEEPIDVFCENGDVEGMVELLEEGEGEKVEDGDEALLKGVELKYRSSLNAALVMLGWAAAAGAFLLVAAQGLVFFWTVEIQDALNQTHNESEFSSLMWISRWFLLPIGVSAGVGVCLHFWSFLTGSTKMQARCASAVLASPYSFFSVNPASKVFSTIASDATVVEQMLAVAAGVMWTYTSQLVGTLVLSVISLWYLIFLFVPLAAIYVRIQRKYSASVTSFAQADAAARNPVSATIATTFDGSSVVRAFQRKDAAWEQLSVAVWRARGTSLAIIDAAGWLGFITTVFIFNAINVGTSIALAVALEPGPDSMGPTVISNVASLASVIGAVAVIVSNVEVASSAVQRLCLFSELPSEDQVVRHPGPELVAQALKEVGDSDSDDSSEIVVKEEGPPELWPSAGAVAYRRAYAAYVWGMPPALKGVTIDIPGGSSCALVGRSGSGKSTAFLALTGMIPVIKGAVEIDGVDVGQVPLHTLRAALAVVPQNPVLFSGPLRPNLDPHGQHGDAALWEALRAVGLNDAVTAAGGLGVDPIAAGMSQGQRQLLCLARALLRDCSILLLDEANASVDAMTERQISATVAAFGAGELTAVTGAAPRRRTVIEVAHRLEGILEMDQVVVLGAGVVLESGPPRELARKVKGEFAGMLNAQGIKM